MQTDGCAKDTLMKFCSINQY